MHKNFGKRKNLVYELKSLTDQLIKEYYNKRHIVLEIHDSIKVMASSCIDIIFEYQTKKPLQGIVDWFDKGKIYLSLN